jgi:plasmid stabilization system protein ParE
MAKIPLALLLMVAVACEQRTGEPDAASTDPAVAPTTPGWAERFSLLRADLDQIEAAHGEKDRDAALASWEQAYRQRFEPLIERPSGGRVDAHAVLAVEYAFGRLRERLESPRAEPVAAALQHLRDQLDLLEAVVVQLPAPTD